MSISPVANGRIWIGCTNLLTPSVVSLLACHQYGRGRTSANVEDIRIRTVSKENNPELYCSPSPSPSPSPSLLLVRGLSPARCRAALTTHKLEWHEHWGKLAELKLKWSTCELVYVGNTNVTHSTLHTFL